MVGVTAGGSPAGIEKRLNLRVTGDVKHVLSELNKVVKTTKDITKISKTQTQTVTRGFNALGRQVKKTTTLTNDFRHKFNFAFLSTMFMGMQMQRTFGRMIKSVVSGFKDVAGSTHPISIAFSRLDANVNFLKFALMDAFGPELINRLADFAERIANMKPENLERIGKSIMGLFVAGSLMFTLSQFQLFVQGVKGIFAKGTTAGAFAASIRKNLTLKNLGIAGGFFVGKLLVSAGLDFIISKEEVDTATKNLLIEVEDITQDVLNVAIASKLLGFSFKKAFPVLAVFEGLKAGFKAIRGKPNMISSLSELLFGRDLVFGLDRFKFSADGAKEALQPTLEDFASAQILSNTTAEEISNLGEAITTNLKPSFEKINPFLTTAKDELKGVNTNTTNFMNMTEDFNTKVNDRASQINTLATSYAKLASNMAAANKVEEEDLTEVPSVSVSGING